MVALTESGAWMGWREAEFAAHCFRDGSFAVSESGRFVGRFGSYEAGDEISLVINRQHRVEYKVQGEIRYVSKSLAQLPLSVKTFFYDVQGEAEVSWAGCATPSSYA